MIKAVERESIPRSLFQFVLVAARSAHGLAVQYGLKSTSAIDK